MTIIRLQDNEFSKTPKLARVYVVRNEDEEREALERYTSRHDRVPERVFVWRGTMYIPVREGEK